MNDSKKKSMFKTITWRIIMIIASLLVAYVFTGSIILSTEITITGNIVATIFYYIHERIWRDYA